MSSASKTALDLLKEATVELKNDKGRKIGFYYKAKNREHVDQLLRAVAQVFEVNCKPYMKMIQLEEE